MNHYRTAYCLVVLALLFTSAGTGNFVEVGRTGQQVRLATTPAPGRTATPTPTAAISPTPAQLNLTLADLNSLAPADMLGEMYFYFGGAGGGLFECDSAPKAVQDARELMDPLVLRLCWPGSDLWVMFKVTRPDGRVESTALWVIKGEVKLFYQPPYDYPPGKYVLRLEGAKTWKEIQVLYQTPKKAHLSELNPGGSPFQLAFSPSGPNRRLILDQFVPGEKVRLLIYKQPTTDREHFSPSHRTLIGWRDMTIRADGRMPVNVSLPSIQKEEMLYFAAWGERSGEVHLLAISERDYQPIDWASGADLYCPGAKKSWLNARHPARAALMPGTRLDVRSAPDADSQIIARLSPGTVVYIIDGPLCSSRVRYWKIVPTVLSENWEGWAAEADASRYLLEPVE